MFHKVLPEECGKGNKRRNHDNVSVVEKSHNCICVNEVERACMSCMHLYHESTNVDALLVQKCVCGGGGRTNELVHSTMRPE